MVDEADPMTNMAAGVTDWRWKLGDIVWLSGANGPREPAMIIGMHSTI